MEVAAGGKRRSPTRSVSCDAWCEIAPEMLSAMPTAVATMSFHILGKSGRGVAREALLFTALAFLVCHELLQRGERDEPEAFDDATFDEAAARKTGDVIRCELYDARGVARADVLRSVDID